MAWCGVLVPMVRGICRSLTWQKLRCGVVVDWLAFADDSYPDGRAATAVLFRSGRVPRRRRGASGLRPGGQHGCDHARSPCGVAVGRGDLAAGTQLVAGGA